MHTPEITREEAKLTRLEAARLAAIMLQPHAAEPGIGQRTLALCILFESYINTGASQTERDMHLLAPRKVKNLQVLAGGNLS